MDRDPRKVAGATAPEVPRWLTAGSRAALGLGGLLLFATASLLAFPPIGLDRLDPGSRGSLRITDRDGHLLRDTPVRGMRATWVGLRDLPPWVPEALVAAEDRRFFAHPGVDPVALARAVRDNLASGRIVSGGSTITQQVVRLLRDAPRRRSPRAKAEEILDAVRLECRLS
jgi:penicillin-binding protein 1C